MLKIASAKSAVYFDDRFWPCKRQQSKGRNKIEITVKPYALIILQIQEKKNDEGRLPPPLILDN